MDRNGFVINTGLLCGYQNEILKSGKMEIDNRLISIFIEVKIFKGEGGVREILIGGNCWSGIFVKY